MRRTRLSVVVGLLVAALGFLAAPAAFAQHEGGEASLVLPDLGSVNFLGSMSGHTLLSIGIVVCLLGLGFGLVFYRQLKNMPVHKSMLEISELIYETCKTYLVTQGKFILLLELFIGAIMIFYFCRSAGLRLAEGRGHPAVLADRHRRQLRRRLVRHPHQHLRELAHGVRQPEGQALSDLRHPAEGGHEHRHAAHQRRAGDDVVHPAVPASATTRAPASSASRSANRWAPPRCASRAASSPRSPTSART